MEAGRARSLLEYTGWYAHRRRKKIEILSQLCVLDWEWGSVPKIFPFCGAFLLMVMAIMMRGHSYYDYGHSSNTQVVLQMMMILTVMFF